MPAKTITQLGARSWSSFHSDETSWYCTGSKTNCRELVADGYTFVDWDSALSTSAAANIELLAVNPSKTQLAKRKLPEFMRTLNRLQHLVMDLPFVDGVDGAVSAVRSLVLARNWDYPDLNSVENPDALNAFRNLEALRIVANHEKETITSTLSKVMLPALRSLEFTVTTQAEMETLQRFRALTDLHLGNVPRSVWSSIDHLPLVALELSGFAKDFVFAPFIALAKLRYLRINGCRSEIDCAVFADMPNLTEIDFLNCKKLRNVEALLLCKKLKRLDVLDCGRPFRGLSDAFTEHGYSELNIAYA
jgi:hypothetical protein